MLVASGYTARLCMAIATGVHPSQVVGIWFYEADEADKVEHLLHQVTAAHVARADAPAPQEASPVVSAFSSCSVHPPCPCRVAFSCGCT